MLFFSGKTVLRQLVIKRTIAGGDGRKENLIA